jgi:hypothetical protein
MPTLSTPFAPCRTTNPWRQIPPQWYAPWWGIAKGVGSHHIGASSPCQPSPWILAWGASSVCGICSGCLHMWILTGAREIHHRSLKHIVILPCTMTISVTITFSGKKHRTSLSITFCRCLVSDRTPGDTLAVLLGRTVLSLVARWFVLRSTRG